MECTGVFSFGCSGPREGRVVSFGWTELRAPMRCAFVALLPFGLTLHGYMVMYLDWGSLALTALESMLYFATPVAVAVVVHGLLRSGRATRMAMLVVALISVRFAYSFDWKSWEIQHVEKRCHSGSLPYCCHLERIRRRDGLVRVGPSGDVSSDTRRRCSALDQPDRGHTANRRDK